MIAIILTVINYNYKYFKKHNSNYQLPLAFALTNCPGVVFIIIFHDI